MKITRRTFGLMAAAMMTALPAIALADYPQRNITLVVPFPPGGGNDAMARIIGDAMTRQIGATVVVENKAGAGGVVGTQAVQNAKPDGYTLLLGHSGTMGINPHVYPAATYHPTRDFTPVGLISEIPLALVVNKDLPAQDVAGLIQLAREKPGELSYASSGVGTGSHMAAELFAHDAGIEVAHIPYRGSGPAMTDLLGGRIDFLFGVIPSSHAQVAAGKARALAVTGAERSPTMPDVPTMQAAGVDGYQAALIYGLLAPAGTPDAVVAKVNAALNAVLADPAVQEKLAVDGSVPRPGTPADHRAALDADLEKWGTLIRDAKIEIH